MTADRHHPHVAPAALREELLQDELDAKEAERMRRKQFKLREEAYAPEKLKQELVAPYKNNAIGAIVVGIGVLSVFFSVFPSLLENDLATSVASFPETL